VTPDADHDLIDELLAGYVLRSLSGEDAREADRLLAEHVPGCPRCRASLLAFTDAAAELALAAEPMAPPDTLLPRLHRELEPRGRGRVASGWTGLAAGVAVVVIVAGVAVSQGLRASDLEQRNDLFGQAIRFAQRPDADAAPLVDAGAADPAPVSELTAPDTDHFYLVGEVPPAPPGLVYGVWLSDGVDAVFAGTFVPEQDVTVVRVPFDRSRFDRVVVTLEVEGAPPGDPGRAVWDSAA
jgi:hypothetical protein